MSRPPIWIPAHQRRPPARPETFYAIHAPMFEARQKDRFIEEHMALLAREVERDLLEDEAE